MRTCLGMGDEIPTVQRSDIVHIIGRAFLGLLNLLTGISAIEEIFERRPWSQRCRSVALKCRNPLSGSAMLLKHHISKLPSLPSCSC